MQGNYGSEYGYGQAYTCAFSSSKAVQAAMLCADCNAPVHYVCLIACLPTMSAYNGCLPHLPMFAYYLCLLCLPTCLQDDVLRGGVIVAAFLHIARMPGPSRGLIEWGYSPERQIHLVLVKSCHFCEIVHIGIIVLRRQIVQFAIHVATAAQ